MAQELIPGVEIEVRKAARVAANNALLSGRPESARKAAIANMARIVATGLRCGAKTTDPWWKVLTAALAGCPSVQPRAGWASATEEYRVHRLTIGGQPSAGLLGWIALAATGDTVTSREVMGVKLFGRRGVALCIGTGVALVEFEKCDEQLLEIQELLPTDIHPEWQWWHGADDAENALVSDVTRALIQKGVGALK